MSEPFDPYHRWLGIPPREQPPNHYRLLGLELFEADREVIDSVALRHIAFLQDITDGPHVKQAQQLLNELAAARRCLLAPDQKAEYDQRLRAELAEKEKPPKAAPPAVAVAAPPKIREDASPGPATRTATGRRARGKRLTCEADRKLPKRMTSKGVLIGASTAVVLGIAAASAVILGGGKPSPHPARESDRGQTAAIATADPTAPKASPPGASETKSDSFADKQPGNPVADSPGSPANDPPADPDAALDMPEFPEDLPLDTALAGDEKQQSPNSGGTETVPRRGLLLWLDAADASTLDIDREGRVRTWSDRSETSSHAEADRADERPVLIADGCNSLPAVRFTGSQCLAAGNEATFDLGSEFTIVSVFRGERGTLLSKGCGDKDGEFCLASGGRTYWSQGEQIPAAANPAEFAARSLVVGDTIAWFVNGTQASGAQENSTSIDNRFKLRIGRPTIYGVDFQDAFVGDLAELLVYDRALDASERESIESYLIDKWLGSQAAPPPMTAAGEATAAASEGLEEPPTDGAVETSPSPSETAEEPLAEQDEPDEAQAEPVHPEKIGWYVNVGGDQFTDPVTGITWMKCPGDSFGCEGDRKRVRDTAAPNPVMGTAERGLSAFRATVPNGIYDVQLFFCDYWVSVPGGRVFTITIERRPVQLNFDVFLRAGGKGRPTSLTLSRIPVSDGRLDVEFRRHIGTPILNGISIQQR